MDKDSKGRAEELSKAKSEERQKIMNLIAEILERNYHCWFTVKELEVMTKANNREVRQSIRDAILDGALIIGSQNGYKWITTQDELDVAVKEFGSREAELRERKEALYRNWNTKNGIQQKGLFE